MTSEFYLKILSNLKNNSFTGFSLHWNFKIIHKHSVQVVIASPLSEALGQV